MTTKALVPNSILRGSLFPSDLFESMDSFLRGLPGWCDVGWELRGFPLGEMTQADGKIKIELALAGYKKEQLSVDVEDDCIVISADKCEDTSRVLSRKAFRKAYYLGNDVDWAKTEAKYKDGLLTVTIPEVVEEEKKKTTIEIK